jgi:hypothetical protein
VHYCLCVCVCARVCARVFSYVIVYLCMCVLRYAYLFVSVRVSVLVCVYVRAVAARWHLSLPWGMPLHKQALTALNQLNFSSHTTHNTHTLITWIFLSKAAAFAIISEEGEKGPCLWRHVVLASAVGARVL